MLEPLKRVLAGQAESKAIPAHPALLSRDPISIYSPGAANGSDGRPRIAQREAPRHLQAYGGNEDAIDWVMDAIRLYEDAAGGAEWHLERKGKRVWIERETETPDDAEVLNDPTLKLLLSEPNPYMTWSDLVKHFVIDILLVGNAYWFKWRQTEDGRPLALYRLSPSYVKVIPGPLGVAAYEYQPPGVKDPIQLSPAQMMHFRLPNPHSNYWGLGIIQGGARALDLELALTDSQASYHENKAEPSIIVQSDRRVPTDVMNKLRLQLRARNAGTKRAGELMVLQAGLKAMTLSASAQEQLYDSLSTLSRDRVLAMFRTSPKLFGTISNSGQDKITDARREFDTYVMKPFLKDLAEKITFGLLSAWGLEFKYDYNYVIPAEDLVKNGSAFAAIPGVKVREVRRYLMPLGVLDEESTGDPSIDEIVLNLPTEELDANGNPIGEADVIGKADRGLAGEAGRPPKGKNTAAFPANGKPVPAGARARRPQSKAAQPRMTGEEALQALERLESKAVMSDGANVSIGRKLDKEKRPADISDTTRDDGVDMAAAAMLPGLKAAGTTLERMLLDHAEGSKAFEPGTLVSRLRKSEAWNAFMTLITTSIERGAVRAASAAAIHQGSRGLLPEDDLDYDAIAREVIFRKDGVRGITDTLKSEIVQKVADAVKAGATREDVDTIIRESILFWQESKAETVALTEAVHAYNEGTLSVAEATGSTEVVVTDGRDDDQPCIDADGAVWEIAHARQHRLEHPRCRRAFIPLPATVS